MCLVRLSNYLKKKYNKKRIGWKVFTKVRNRKKLNGFIYNRQNSIYRTNAWLNEKDFRDEECKSIITIGTYPTNYEVGWHIFLTKTAALKYIKDRRIRLDESLIIKKVRFRKPCAYGYQKYRSLKCVVAKEMLIEEDNQ